MERPICYGAVNWMVVNSIAATATRFLDLGCGTGSLGEKIKEKTAREVVGVTFSEDEAAIAARRLDQVIVSDLNNPEFGEIGQFDCIICSHVLEHLYQPENLLVALRKHLSPAAELIVAVPNILHWKQRLKFLRGQFRYTVGGIMDSTHFRFFDWETACTLVKRSGYDVRQRIAGGNLPQPYVRLLFPNTAKLLDGLACRYMPGMFGDQFIIVASPRS